MAELTMNQALAHVALAETMEWLSGVRATVRFYDDTDGFRVRVAVRTNLETPDDFTAVLVPMTDSTVESLAVSLVAARDTIEAQIRRRTLYAVPTA